MEKQDLIKIIGNINSDFPNDKLAYLAMTSKIEGQLRDAISHQIHLFYYKNSTTPAVCREWKQIDMAVANLNDIPELLIEFKSHNSIDFPGFLLEKKKKPKESYPIAKDFNKLVKYTKRDTKSYFIFFNNFVRSTTNLPPNCKGEKNNPIAYRSNVSKLINLPYIDKVKKVLKNWAYLLQQLGLPMNLTSVIEFKVGQYRGIEVSILAFIFGPIVDNVIDNSLIIKLPGNNERKFDDPKFDDPDLRDVDWSEIDFYYESDELKDIKMDLNFISSKS